MTTPTPPTVLVGVDGSDASLAAADLGADEAVLHHCRLRLVGVLHRIDGAAMRTARSELDAAARRVSRRHPGLAVTTAVLVGMPGNVLVEESARAELLVVGYRGRGGFAAVVGGAVHAQVATSARCPVLVARPEAPGAETAPEGPIVVGVDGSVHAARAVAFGFEEAARRGIPLVAVQVWSVPPHPPNGDPTRAATEAAAAERQADAVVTAAVTGIRDEYPGVPVVTELIHGADVEETLVRRSAAASLTVVGSRGVGGVAGALLGSVGHALIHHAHSPVAIVRPAGDG
ncbi:MAG: uspA protein [Cryptosporangiaceae bacterium]|jgi:nucleotide-binding universal stress UspA family protein|nr:uspA protein [Cryptosporangiaceae bacterium]